MIEYSKKGMVFNFQVGFNSLIDKSKEQQGFIKASKYALLMADTVIVTDNKPEFLTSFQRNLIDYTLTDEPETQPQKKRQ